MRNLIVCTGVIALVIGVLQLTPGTIAEVQDQQNQKGSDDHLLAYGVGYYLGDEVRSGLELDGVQVEIDTLLEGFRDGVQGVETKIPRKDLDRVLVAVHQEMQRRMVKRLIDEDPNFKTLHEENGRKGVAFIEQYRRRPGVITLDNGVMYRVLRDGAGPTADAHDTIVVSFRGTLIDGTEFAQAKSEAMRPVDAVNGGGPILEMMPAGARWEVVLPGGVAYMGAGNPPLVGPNETVIFDVEMVEVKK